MSTGKNVDHSFTVGRHASVLNEERTMRPENLILFNSQFHDVPIPQHLKDDLPEHAEMCNTLIDLLEGEVDECEPRRAG